MNGDSGARGYINPYVGGILLGVVLFSAYFFTQSGLGASGAIGKVQIALVKLVAPGHVNRNSYFAKEGGGDKNALDSGAVFMLLGTFLGGLASGLINRRVRPETRRGPQITDRQRWIFAFVGGAVMGYGARLARGCTSGQALSGGAVLAVGSWAFMLCVFIGGYALAYFVRRLWN
ncbi:MAG TPA: YeeE/YedE thiosulfate transporter family protein [Spirochaetota bacterium]|nr:YeeE/YedE thiosulfate transporter family protein [Spirochaetota bacterium]HNT12189.1 YeeE/YedE thiosulfate transporter family protein [Spirochaetota bacterium]HOS41545.1 YeeE/YedE thiosulfate transporter family protein [Spirochaetota bacterium]HPI22817.1 YeeE/YedE thiosulfate transporter family protein [Spirochaetota bacterium]HPU89539.1 YeeE/YedE thiosulfate transporter family protein [Spirochaetota bacterium]